MKPSYSKYREKYQNFLKSLNLVDKPIPIEERNELLELFAGAYEEKRILLVAVFPDLSEETLDEIINRILSDSLFRKEPSAEAIICNDKTATLAKAAIYKSSKN